MSAKKTKPVSETAGEMFAKHFNGMHYSDITEEKIEKYAIDFARLKVSEALHETSLHFKNPENVSYIKNHYSLDKIV
jgi:hypothetical protein